MYNKLKTIEDVCEKSEETSRFIFNFAVLKSGKIKTKTFVLIYISTILTLLYFLTPFPTHPIPQSWICSWLLTAISSTRQYMHELALDEIPGGNCRSSRAGCALSNTHNTDPSVVKSQ